MTAQTLRRGSGRQSEATVQLWEAQVELAIFRDEVLQATASCWPHVGALYRGAEELGPVALHHAISLARLLRSIERKVRETDL